MSVIRAAVFILSLLVLPLSAFLTVLYIIIIMIRGMQIQEENGEK